MLRFINFLFRKIGFVLISIQEIENMEIDANNDYSYVKKVDSVSIKAYFNGMADYASKKSFELRKKYRISSL